MRGQGGRRPTTDNQPQSGDGGIVQSALGGRSSVVGRQPLPSGAEELPVSVVVPARDEGQTVDALLASLVAQSRPPAEILVVDAGSRDDTAERVRRWSARCPRVRLVDAGPAFPGEARNAGIAAAAWEWIAMTDAGVQVDREWLAELWRAREEAPAAELVFGHYEPALRDWLSECAALTYLPPCTEEHGLWWRGDSFASVLLRREVWVRCGGFPAYRAAEDLIFLEAIRRDGCLRATAPRARVSWELPPTIAATFRRFACYSRHNLLARRGRYWHRGVARLYAGAAALGIAGAALSPLLWTLLPVAMAARAVRAVATRHRGSHVVHPWRPDRILGVAALQFVLDAATLWGALVWLWKDGRGSWVVGRGSKAGETMTAFAVAGHGGTRTPLSGRRSPDRDPRPATRAQR